MFDAAATWVVTSLSGIIVGLVNWFTILIDDLSLETIAGAFPQLSALYTIILTIAASILILSVAFQAWKTFGPAGLEAESPVGLFGRALMAVILLPFSFTICKGVFDLTKIPYESIKAKYDEMDLGLGNFLENFFSVDKIKEAAIGAVTGQELEAIPALLISIIFICFIGWNVIKLCLEIVERYVVVAALAYTSPLPFATMATKTTSGIFQKWCRMFGGQILLIVINIWSITVLMSAFTTQGSLDILLWFMLVFGFLKFAQNADSLLQRLGLEVTTTGGSLMEEMVGTAAAIGGTLKTGGNMAVQGVSGGMAYGAGGAVLGALGGAMGVNAMGAMNAVHGATAAAAATAANSAGGTVNASDTTTSSGGPQYAPNNRGYENFTNATKGKNGMNAAAATNMGGGSIAYTGTVPTASGKDAYSVRVGATENSQGYNAQITPANDFVQTEDAPFAQTEKFKSESGEEYVISSTETPFAQFQQEVYDGGTISGENITPEINKAAAEYYNLPHASQLTEVNSGVITYETPTVDKTTGDYAMNVSHVSVPDYAKTVPNETGWRPYTAPDGKIYSKD